EGHRDPVTGVLPRVRCDSPRFAHAARREYDGFRAERDELPALAPVADRAGHALAVGEQVAERALHEDVDPLSDGRALQRADPLQSGAVTHVREPRVSMPAEVALQD